MKKRFKKSAFFLAVMGFVFLSVSLFFGYKQYQIISTGEEVTGAVSRIITIRGEDSTTYKPEISYRHQDVEHLYTPSYSSSLNSRLVGDPVVLFVADSGVTIKGFNGALVGILMGLVTGLIVFISGLLWFLKHRRDFDEAARLKRYGNRVSAQYVRSESTKLKINDQSGIILFLQQNNSDKIFKSKPIYSNLSIKWLEEHSFDVYVDMSDSSKYFIDLEKHFGHPVSG